LTHTFPPDLIVHDLRIGKHMLDIRFLREGQHTAFDVIKGDRKLVERTIHSRGCGTENKFRVYPDGSSAGGGTTAKAAVKEQQKPQ
jgi:hypothetical protein